MIRGKILICAGFVLSGVVGGLTARYISHHSSSNGFIIGFWGLIAAVLTFVIYGAILTKLGK
jgi:hypothetical protein